MEVIFLFICSRDARVLHRRGHSFPTRRSSDLVIGGGLGLGSAVLLVILGPTVWVDVFGNKEAIFPYAYPALFSMTIAFLGIWIFSLLDNSKEAQEDRAGYEMQNLRMQTGIGSSGAIDH